MSQRYHRGGTYQTQDSKAVHSPLRSSPLLRPADAVFGPAWHEGTWNKSKPVATAVPIAPAASISPQNELACAEAALREAERMHTAARREIGDANRTKTQPVIVAGRVIVAAQPFTAERTRQRKSAAFKLFNARRAQLTAAKRQLATARVGHGSSGYD